MTDTVLYIDDDESNLVVLKATCADELNVITASSGAEGLKILAEQEIAVLLVDQRMPGMTGVEVFEVAQEKHPDAIRILITAYTDLTDAIAAINRGHIRRYLRKPWEPEELKAALREAVELYQTRKKITELETRLLETERTYALGVVAAGVAHELRNPLAAMSMNLELARMRLDTMNGGLAAGDHIDPAHLVSLSKALEKLDGAVDNVKKIAEGLELTHRRRDEEVTADLAEILELTLKFMRAALLKRGRLEVETSPVPIVQGSPQELGQVLVNLLVNAMQAIPDDSRAGGLVGVRLEPADEMGWVKLQVYDNGKGIPADVVSRIFDPFFTTKSQGGTGLGLAISKRIVEQAGGTITAESTPGQGTTFTVELPVAVS
ncbi:MAG: hybrid sensor histidine kinase/response regulator [Holophagae bacterium]|jgi:signal transduction histidine kinase